MNTKRIRALTHRLEEVSIPLDGVVKIGLALTYFPESAETVLENLAGTSLEEPARKVFQALAEYRVAEIIKQQKLINSIVDEIREEVGK